MAVIAGVPVLFRRVASGEYDVIADAESIALGLHMLGRICRTADGGWGIVGVRRHKAFRFPSRRAAATVLVATWSLRERVQAVTHD